MSKIGYLQPSAGAFEELHGEVQTLHMQLKLKLHPNNSSMSENAPDYLVCTPTSNNADVQIGAAWKKQKQKLGDVTLEFLSLTIDDPSFPHPLNVAAFPNNEGGYDITWRRRQTGNQTVASPSGSTDAA